MIRSHKGIAPRIGEGVYIDDSAQIIGDVVIGDNSSVWPNAVIRGDVYYIRIGSETNIQDNCVLHVETNRFALFLGDRVTIGHSAVLHGCRIGPRCLIGMGALILNNSEIGEGSIVAAGTVVPENAIIPPGSVCMGVPAKVIRQATEDDLRRIDRGANNYLRLKEEYLAERRGNPA